MTDDLAEARRRAALARGEPGGGRRFSLAETWEDLPEGTASQYFVLGYEYALVQRLIADGWQGSRPIHTANAGRLRRFCDAHQVLATFTPHVEPGFETWTEIKLS